MLARCQNHPSKLNSNGFYHKPNHSWQRRYVEFIVFDCGLPNSTNTMHHCRGLWIYRIYSNVSWIFFFFACGKYYEKQILYNRACNKFVRVTTEPWPPSYMYLMLCLFLKWGIKWTFLTLDFSSIKFCVYSIFFHFNIFIQPEEIHCKTDFTSI